MGRRLLPRQNTSLLSYCMHVDQGCNCVFLCLVPSFETRTQTDTHAQSNTRPHTLKHTGVGCFRKCHFGIPRNTEFYTELVLFRVIPRNFLLFNSAEFRIGSCISNSIYLQISPLHFALCSQESSLKILEDSLGP